MVTIVTTCLMQQGNWRQETELVLPVLSDSPVVQLCRAISVVSARVMRLLEQDYNKLYSCGISWHVLMVPCCLPRMRRKGVGAEVVDMPTHWPDYSSDSKCKEYNKSFVYTHAQKSFQGST